MAGPSHAIVGDVLSRAAGTRAADHNRIGGADHGDRFAAGPVWMCTPRKVLAVTVDGESGELRTRRLPGDDRRGGGVLRARCRARRAWPMRRGRPGSGWRARCSAAGHRVRGRGAGQDRAARAGPRQDRPRDAERLVRLLMIGGLHAVRVPSGEEEALRDLVRAREDVRGDLMRARQRLGKLLLRHDVRYEDAGQRVDGAPPRLAGDDRARRARRAGDAARLPRRDRRARHPPRRARGDDRRAGARLAVGADGRAAALPARHRHALGGRAVRRDRRLRALRARRRS